MSGKEFRLDTVPVSSKFVVCSLLVDRACYIRCGRSADWAVYSPEGSLYLYRCTKHRSVVSLYPTVEGNYTAEVPTMIMIKEGK